jgi:hypothetical protein
MKVNPDLWETVSESRNLSVLASSGMSLPIIGALLGHTQPATTAPYAHLLDDPLREATERAGVILARRTKTSG